MKQERKEALLCAFPAVPEKINQIMTERKKGAENFVVLLTHGNELFIRCFHKYYRGDLIERQRYVFAKDGFCRYGLDPGNNWVVRKDFREPIFSAGNYGGYFDNSYEVLNYKALKQSCMKYSCAELFNKTLMEYLRLYCKHPNIEYLVKSRYDGLIEETAVYSWYGSYALNIKLRVSSFVNLKSNNLLKMLGLNRTEFKLLQGQEKYYENYCQWRENYRNFKPDELLLMARAFGGELGTVETVETLTNVRLPRIAEYLCNGDISTHDYLDYLWQCRDLEYNTSDTAICMPHDFNAMHERLSEIIKYRHSEETLRLFKENYSPRKELEFANGKYIIRQPESMDEIIDEGAKLHHCVGGYAERHAKGVLTIMFLRKKSDPEKPYYTIEVSRDYKIVQCRGYRNNMANNPKPKAVSKFEERYQQYLNALIGQKARKNDKTGNENAASRCKPHGDGRIYQGGEPEPQNNYGGAARAAVAV